MSSRNFFVKFNLDLMRHDMESCKGEHQEWEWFKGFRAGAAGNVPSSPPGPMRAGEEFGYAAWQDANRFRASRAANIAKRWAKEKKSLQTSKEEKVESREQPAESVVLQVYSGSIGVVSERDENIFDTSGVAPQTPPASRVNYEACDEKFARRDSDGHMVTPKVTLPERRFEDTPEGKKALALRERLRRAAK